MENIIIQLSQIVFHSIEVFIEEGLEFKSQEYKLTFDSFQISAFHLRCSSLEFTVDLALQYQMSLLLKVNVRY